jgi:linoleoyl-CoA desaturase
MAKVTFDNSNNLFFQSLKASVDDYFKQNNLRKTGNWRLYLKTVILISTAIVLYGSLIFLHPPGAWALLICAVLGYNLACIGFSVMHDANHGSYSTHPLLNDFLGLSMNAMGASSFFWKQKHNIIHHTYTNVDGIDDDIAKSPIIRQCESQKWVPAHKVQHLYLFPAYALSTIFWVFIMDFKKYFTHKIYTTDAWKLTLRNHIVFWATKILYVAFYMVIPAMIWGFWAWFAGYLVMMSLMGLTLSIVFQLAHVVENTEFEHIALEETKQINTSWAEFELRTTSNFAMNNPVISWFVGGLNFQVEHHLFPKISHIHYPAISKIVMQKCKEFNMPYNYYPTMWGAMLSHFRIMRLLGQSQVVPRKSHMRTPYTHAA